MNNYFYMYFEKDKSYIQVPMKLDNENIKNIEFCDNGKIKRLVYEFYSTFVTIDDIGELIETTIKNKFHFMIGEVLLYRDDKLYRTIPNRIEHQGICNIIKI